MDDGTGRRIVILRQVAVFTAEGLRCRGEDFRGSTYLGFSVQGRHRLDSGLRVLYRDVKVYRFLVRV